VQNSDGNGNGNSGELLDLANKCLLTCSLLFLSFSLYCFASVVNKIIIIIIIVSVLFR